MEDKTMLPMITRRSYRPLFLPGLFDDDFFRSPSAAKEASSSKPAVNIREDEKSYTLELAVPGINKKDLKIEVNEDILTISMEHSEENKKEEDSYRRKEFSYSSFCRSFYLPEDSNRDKIEASYKDGVLSIELQKSGEQAKLSRVVKIS
jgi:HSP20 family protein